MEEEQSVVGKELAFGLRLLKPYTNSSMHLTCLCTRESILAMMFNDLWNQTQGLQARIPNPSEILQGEIFFSLLRRHVHHKIGAILHPMSCARRSNEGRHEQRTKTRIQKAVE